MTALAESHPVLRKLPEEIKKSLAVDVGDWKGLPVNRRQRKRLQRDGFITTSMLVNPQVLLWAAPGKNRTATATPISSSRFDLQRGEGHNMLLDTGVYAGLMCAVMHDKLEALVGGPNCRTRSVLAL